MGFMNIQGGNARQSTGNELYSESNYELDSAILNTDAVDDHFNQNAGKGGLRPSGLTHDQAR